MRNFVTESNRKNASKRMKRNIDFAVAYSRIAYENAQTLAKFIKSDPTCSSLLQPGPVSTNIHDSVCETILHANRTANEVSYFLDRLSAELDPEIACKADMAPDDGSYKVITNPSGTFARVPLAPYSAAKVQGKKKSVRLDTGRRRYRSLIPMIERSGLHIIHGRKLVYLLHVHPENTPFFRMPDFDNYDVKGLIDAVTLYHGGDNQRNILLWHDATSEEKTLEPGTYIGVTKLREDLSYSQLKEIFMSNFRKLTEAADAVK